MRTTTAVLLLALVLLLGACQGLAAPAGTPSAPDRLAEIRNRGVLRVGVSDFVPWVMKDKRGKRMGFEIDIVAKLAADLGVQATVVPMPWSRLIPALAEGQVDMIASGMSITPSRALLVNFTIPYHYSEIGIVANRDKAPGLTSRMDFDDGAMKVSVVKGTTAEATARWALPAALITAFDTQEQALGAVRDGQTHASVASSPVPRLAMLRHPAELYLPLESPLARTAEAFAIQKGDPDLLAYLNAWIEARRADRWLERRQAYWFMSIGWEKRL